MTDQIISAFQQVLEDYTSTKPDRYNLSSNGGSFTVTVLGDQPTRAASEVMNAVVNAALQRMGSYLKTHVGQTGLDWIDGGLVKARHSGGRNLRWEIALREVGEREVSFTLGFREVAWPDAVKQEDIETWNIE